MATNAERGFFRNAFDAMVEARTRQANRYVNESLSWLGEPAVRGGASKSAK